MFCLVSGCSMFNICSRENKWMKRKTTNFRKEQTKQKIKQIRWKRKNFAQRRFSARRRRKKTKEPKVGYFVLKSFRAVDIKLNGVLLECCFVNRHRVPQPSHGTQHGHINNGNRWQNTCFHQNQIDINLKREKIYIERARVHIFTENKSSEMNIDFATSMNLIARLKAT